MKQLLHFIGFHGANWDGVWIKGNIWTECRACGARRMVSFGNASEIPSEVVAAFPVRED